jgi:D-alanyl-D-alanine carboxypeptidase
VLLAALLLAAACGSDDTDGAPVGTVSTTTAPPTTSPRGDPELEEQMAGILEAHRAEGEFVGAVLALRKADGTTVTVTSGHKNLSDDSDPVDPSIPWGIGSATKTFVAVVVLQLAEEGAIDLDAGIDRYLPNLPGADRITPRQLLQHTSGLAEYLELPAVQADAKRPWSPSELIAAAEATGRAGEPGDPFHYANTNYLVLGEIIEQVTDNSWEVETRERILDPLGMVNTRLGAKDGTPGFGLVDGTFVDYTDRWHPSLGGAAGALQATSSDLLLFAEALAEGRLLSAASQAQMATFIPGWDLSAFGVRHGYGLGLEEYATEELTVYGHLGSASASSSFIGYADGTAVVVMMNSDNAGPQAVMALEALATANS